MTRLGAALQLACSKVPTLSLTVLTPPEAVNYSKYGSCGFPGYNIGSGGLCGARPFPLSSARSVSWLSAGILPLSGPHLLTYLD